MTVHAQLSSLVRFELDDAALGALAWKDFGNGTKMAKLAREDETGIVVYRLGADAGEGSFRPHVHPGGEAYLVLRGTVIDETGTYPAGSFVWMAPGSKHTPRGAAGEDTVIAVMWPAGVVTE